MIIALSGNDGSGKSTVAQSLMNNKLLKGQKIHAQEFNGVLISALKKIAKPKNTASSDEISPHASSLMPYLVWLDLNLTSIYHRIFHRSKTVIIERGPIDYLATWKELGNASKVIEKLYSNFTLMPHLTVYLRVSPDTAMRRRAQQKDGRKPKSKKFYQIKYEIYEHLSALFNPVVVDNNTQLRAVVSEIINTINLRNRFSKLRKIAISGLDGAGKSTTTSELSSYLTKLNVRHASKHFYYEYVLLKPLKLLKGRSSKTASGEEEQDYSKSIAKEEKHLASGKSKFWVVFVLADAGVQYAFSRIFAFRRLIIYDRFFPDYLISFDFLNVKYDKEKLLKIFPNPDRYYLQIADYKVLYDRKPEHSLEFFRQCYEKYGELAKDTGMIKLDSTNRDKKQILNDLLETI